MKRQLLLATLFIAVVAGGPCFAGDAKLQFYIPAFNEPIYGTWINEGYLGNGYYPQKFVVFNWGYTETYFKMGDKSCSGRNTFILMRNGKTGMGTPGTPTMSRHQTEDAASMSTG